MTGFDWSFVVSVRRRDARRYGAVRRAVVIGGLCGMIVIGNEPRLVILSDGDSRLVIGLDSFLQAVLRRAVLIS